MVLSIAGKMERGFFRCGGPKTFSYKKLIFLKIILGRRERGSLFRHLAICTNVFHGRPLNSITPVSSVLTYSRLCLKSVKQQQVQEYFSFLSTTTLIFGITTGRVCNDIEITTKEQSKYSNK